MKFANLICITAVSLSAALAIPVLVIAQNKADGNQTQPHYKLIDMATFGGPDSYLSVPDSGYGQILNNQGALTGWAATPKKDPYPNFCLNLDCFVSRAFQWQNGVRTKLPGLAKGLSSQTTWISSNGIIAGISQNGQLDPSFVPGPFPVTHGVIWKDGVITDLGTLDGGFESAALAVNSHGQVVGAADNVKPDAAAMYGFNWGWVTRTRAFLWQDGIMQDLQTLGGPDAVAYLINDSGQVAGVSYLDSKPSKYCANLNYALTTGAFLWENGTMQNLGSFGGTCTFAYDLNNAGEVVGASTLKGDKEQHPFLWEQGNLIDLGTFGGGIGNAIALNERGEVVGFASYPGDQIFHGALWRDGAMTDLGTLEVSSFAQAVNAQDQVVGFSTDAQLNNHQGFLWQKDAPMVALNSLVSSSSLQLTDPYVINDRGEIAGFGTDSMGNQHAFLLIPCDENHPDVEGCDYSKVDAATAEVVRLNPKGTDAQSSQAAPSASLNGLDHAMPRDSGRPAPRTYRPSIPADPMSERDDISKTFSPSNADLSAECMTKDHECDPLLPRLHCCPGLICAGASDRAFCQ